jgi:hypothetical protein
MTRAAACSSRQFCRRLQGQTQLYHPRVVLIAHPPPGASRPCVQVRKQLAPLPRHYATSARAPRPSGATTTAAKTPEDASSRALPDLGKLVTLVEQTCSRLLSAESIPSTKLTTVGLKTLETAASAIKPLLSRKPPAANPSTLLNLDNSDPQKKAANPHDIAEKLSLSAFEIINHPNVALDSEILKLYVNIQCLLGKPKSIPHAFELFAEKPLPKLSGGSIVYKKQRPKRLSAGIDEKVADKALEAAIEARDLDTAVGITEACYTGTAHLKAKLARNVTLPFILTCGAPAMVYFLSLKFADLNPYMDPVRSTKIAFGGITAYLVFTSSLGIMAKLTNMDHMVRVTWQPGTPLIERWRREEERAALDKVSMAWGYKETWRQGEETGVDWMSLREYIGRRGMILDRVEFMEGMNPKT